MTGASPLHAVKPVEEENDCKPELLSSMRKMAELCVLEKIYEKLTVIVRSVLPVIRSVSFLVKKVIFESITSSIYHDTYNASYMYTLS